jgi:N-acetylmuramoyl-L-alanine amidase
MLKGFLKNYKFRASRKMVIALLLTLGLLMALTWNNQFLSGNVVIAPKEECGKTGPAPEVSLKDKQDAIKITQPQQVSNNPLEVAVVTAVSGIARVAPDDDASRLTPLPKGTKAIITEKKGDWLKLDYGAWINRLETQVINSPSILQSSVNNLQCRQTNKKTEIVFPLQVPLPMKVVQGGRTLAITLYNATTQNLSNFLKDDPVLTSVIQQQIVPGQVRYTLNLKNQQQWGYSLQYQGNKLVLSLRHPPEISQEWLGGTLSGIKILLDPGHGGMDSGAVAGEYQEKKLALDIGKLLEEELKQKGATVYMTREDDRAMTLDERVAMIREIEPNLSISLHYNQVPSPEYALGSKGVEAFWYHPQSREFAKFIHDYIVKNLNRPSKGVFWKNLALARPTVAPSILLELGFMSHPEDLEWVVNSFEQQRLAQTIADGVVEWLKSFKS